MKSAIGEALRSETIATALGMTATERFRLALELGERDLLFFMRGNDLTRDEALRLLRDRSKSSRSRR